MQFSRSALHWRPRLPWVELEASLIPSTFSWSEGAKFAFGAIKAEHFILRPGQGGGGVGREGQPPRAQNFWGPPAGM
jgi:hypothetical protein